MRRSGGQPVRCFFASGFITEKEGRISETEMENLLIRRMDSLLSKNDWFITNLSNAAALLKESMKDVSWAGFYLVRGGELVLGPFQGKTACTHICFGKGVCGTAALKDQTQRVADIRRFRGYIVCDSEAESEIVVPIHNRDGTVAGVLDLDSATEGRFSQDDQAVLEAAAKVIENVID